MTAFTEMSRTAPILNGNIPWRDHVVGSLQSEGVPAQLVNIREMPAELRPGLTVAICTYCRPESLSRLLDSIAVQDRRPEQLVIVDASPDDSSERALRGRPSLGALADRLVYVRVTGPLKGLTRQRNLALRLTDCERVAFFDDDMVLAASCLREMERPHRERHAAVAGVAGMIENQCATPGLLWRARRVLGIVTTLQPGDYCRSGLSVSWNFLPRDAAGVREGRWLQGGATMWQTSAARRIGFNETFQGYSSGEDLEFSLRMGREGLLLLAADARMVHLHDTAGRPDSFMMGYMGLKNLHHIQRTCLTGRTWRDGAWFVYAFGMDTLIRAMWLVYPGETWERVQFLRGRLRYFRELLWKAAREAEPGAQPAGATPADLQRHVA